MGSPDLSSSMPNMRVFMDASSPLPQEGTLPTHSNFRGRKLKKHPARMSRKLSSLATHINFQTGTSHPLRISHPFVQTPSPSPLLSREHEFPTAPPTCGSFIAQTSDTTNFDTDISHHHHPSVQSPSPTQPVEKMEFPTALPSDERFNRRAPQVKIFQIPQDQVHSFLKNQRKEIKEIKEIAEKVAGALYAITFVIAICVARAIFFTPSMSTKV